MPSLPPSCSCSVQLPGTPSTLSTEPQTARAEAAERKARHLRICAEMAEIGMVLLRAAARHAEADLAEPTPTDPQPQTPARDPALTFARLTGAIRQAITLEARIAGDSFGPAPPRPAPPYDPRRAKMRLALHQAVEKQPDSTSLQRHIDDSLEEALAADPNAESTIPALFDAICAELGIDPDFTLLADSQLNSLCNGGTPDESDEDELLPPQTAPPPGKPH